VVVVKLVYRPTMWRGQWRWAERGQTDDGRTDGRATVWPAASRRIDRRPGHHKPTAPARSAGDLVYRRETGKQASEPASVADTNANRRAIHHHRSPRGRTRFAIVWRCGGVNAVRTETLGYSRLSNALIVETSNIQTIFSRTTAALRFGAT